MGMGAAQGGKGGGGSAAPSSRPQANLGGKGMGGRPPVQQPGMGGKGSGTVNPQPGFQPKGGANDVPPMAQPNYGVYQDFLIKRALQNGMNPKGAGQMPKTQPGLAGKGFDGMAQPQPGMNPKGVGQNLQDAMGDLSGIPRQVMTADGATNPTFDYGRPPQLPMTNVLPVRPPVKVNPGKPQMPSGLAGLMAARNTRGKR